MAFTGGPLSVVGIVPSYTSNLGQQTSASGVVQAQNQVWQGVGESFVGRPGQPLTGKQTGLPINVALNSDTLSNVSGPGGNALNVGANVLAPSLTKYLGGTQAYGINRQLGESLRNAGSFGSLLSRGGASSLASVAALTRGVGGAVSSAVGSLVGSPNYIMFPGAGNEGAANYAGVPYSLQDVTFSLQPANRGPQSFGTSQSTSFPKSMTTLPFNEYTSMPPLAGSPTANALKSSSMVNGLSKSAFTPSVGASNFNTSTPRLF
jgi:hypothetical protein